MAWLGLYVWLVCACVVCGEGMMVEKRDEEASGEATEEKTTDTTAPKTRHHYPTSKVTVKWVQV
jgi:hypothetical protein